MVYLNARDQAVASADFAKLAHIILRQRFLRACVYEVPFAYMVAVVANLSFRTGVFSLLYALVLPRTLGYTVAAYLAGVASLIVHAQLFQVTRAAHSSHFPRLQRLLRHPASTGTAVGVYVLLAYFLLIVHRAMFGGNFARMWLYPEGAYGPPQLNPGWLASWVFATAMGAGYALSLLANERLQLAFPAIEQSRIYALKDRLPGSFARAFGFATGVLWRFWLGYFVFGWGLYRSVCGVLARIFSTSAYGVGSPLLSASSLIFWLHSGVLMTLTWELAHQLFETILTEPTHINELSLDRNLCLLNGLKHSDSPLIQHLAFQELYRLTTFSAEQRTEILTDIDRPSGTMWTQISGECIGVIKAATTQLQAQAPPPEKPKPAKPALASSFDASVAVRAGGAPMKDILQRNRRAPPNGQPPAPAEPTSSVDLFGIEAQGLEKYVLTALRDMLMRSPLGQRIWSRSQRARSISTFSNFQQQVWAVRALMRLVERSIVEDQFGVVQADISSVLGCLLAYLTELERSAAQTDGTTAYNVQAASRQTVAMVQVLRNSLYTFTTTFYEYLEALKLPPALARQLQPFADFKA
ncbi:Nuclear pore complex subunit [Coemansia sp. RSA 2704]|nr:Nuclear pore complex subunit [Coemansia sp. RSA 2705]KAJ2321586.1 Nuclear pore complex subunit [Coemansia sp. RSA 2704]